MLYKLLIFVLHNLINIYSPRRLGLEYLKVLSEVHSGEKSRLCHAAIANGMEGWTV